MDDDFVPDGPAGMRQFFDSRLAKWLDCIVYNGDYQSVRKELKHFEYYHIAFAIQYCNTPTVREEHSGTAIDYFSCTLLQPMLAELSRDSVMRDIIDQLVKI